MKILALDISSVSTGWAVLENDKLVKGAYGLITMKQKLHGERLIYFEAEVSKLLDEYKPEHFFIEEIFKGPSLKTFKILSYYQGAVHKVCFKYYQNMPNALGASSVRRLLEKKYEVSLILSKRERLITKKTSKELTFEFIKKKFILRSFTFKKSNDITDAIALALAAHLSLQGSEVPCKTTTNIGEYFAKSTQGTKCKPERKRGRNKKSIP